MGLLLSAVNAQLQAPKIFHRLTRKNISTTQWQELRLLAKSNTIKVCEADKGASLVLMDKVTNNSRVELEILGDRDNYNPVLEDPAKAVLRKYLSLGKRLVKKGQLKTAE
jgi:hypothetical protein